MKYKTCTNCLFLCWQAQRAWEESKVWLKSPLILRRRPCPPKFTPIRAAHANLQRSRLSTVRKLFVGWIEEATVYSARATDRHDRSCRRSLVYSSYYSEASSVLAGQAASATSSCIGMCDWMVPVENVLWYHSFDVGGGQVSVSRLVLYLCVFL